MQVPSSTEAGWTDDHFIHCVLCAVNHSPSQCPRKEQCSKCPTFNQMSESD